MATKLITNDFSAHTLNQIIESITEASNSAYYFFVGNHNPQDNGVPSVVNSTYNKYVDVYKNMIQGKRISNSDIRPMIRNISYVSNTVYDIYDDQDSILDEKNFFTIVDEGSYLHVYKCLDNNMNAVSTAQPTISHITGANNTLYQTADGYRWKYMYSVSSAQDLKFSTSDYFPVFPNTTISNAATVVPGAIDIILVEGTGQGYDNYLTGTFSTSDLRINGNSTVYAISNTSAFPANGFYTGCLMYLSSGTGVGQYSIIDTYFSNSEGKYVILDTAFTTNPTNGTRYQIYPNVIVQGSGKQTINCVARALVNSLASNSVYRVEILERGSEYDYVYSANAVANDVVDVAYEAELRAIHSPYPGHGYDPVVELQSTCLGISMKFANNESNTILVTNDFQQIGILKDPLFCNVAIAINDTSNPFQVDEYVYKVKPVQLNLNCTSEADNTVITCNSADFINQLNVGDPIIIKNSANTYYQLAYVNSLSNSSYMTIVANAAFSCTETIMYKTEILAEGYALTVNSSQIVCTNVAGQFAQGDYIIGKSSDAFTTVNAISRSNDSKGFETFIQLYKYYGDGLSGTFQQDEIVYQDNQYSTANATLHSYSSNSGNVTVYTSNQSGAFVVGTLPVGYPTLYGTNSGASVILNTRHYPELVPHSGEVLFVENIEPITRSSNTSETFQVIINFK